MVELKHAMKEKDDQIGLNKGPTIVLARKGGPKKQSPRSCSFLSKTSLPNMGWICVFSIYLKKYSSIL